MYQFSGKIKLFSIILVVVGVLGIGWGFYDGLGKTEEDAKAAIAAQHSDGHHGDHGNAHGDAAHHDGDKAHKEADHKDEHASENHEAHQDALVEDATKDAHKSDAHSNEGHHDTKDSEEEHIAHVLHQMHNRPWASLYVALIFFLGISLLVLAFYAAQRVAQSGWSIVLFRVMEAITANLVPTSIIMLLVIIASVMHYNHLFVWMETGTMVEGHENFDPIVYGKRLWLNETGWVIRGVLYLLAWNAYRWYIRRNSIVEDSGDIKIFKRNYNVSVVFLVIFMLSESMASWDWIMGLDPHWFSTLFGWYVLASLLVSALTVIAFVTIYLRSKGYLPKVNDSHIHDLAKFMFGFSVFWTYLWFAQFMLIWYADIPEETTYFALRFNEYKTIFLSMLVMNFVFPILLLLNSDFKSRPWFVFIGGTVILIGHYVDLFIMIMPGTVGGSWNFGIPELGAALFFIGVFIYTVFSAFAKADPVAKGNPFLKESEHFHYYNIEHHSGSGEDHH